MSLTKHISLAVLVLFFGILSAQDSLLRLQLRLSDLNFHASGMLSEPNVNFAEMMRFTGNPGFTRESDGYTQTDQPSYMDYHDQGDFGLYGTFMFRTKNALLRRIKPRLGLYYCSRTLSYSRYSYHSTTTIDSLHFTNPNVLPLLIDSVSAGRLSYRYNTGQLMLEAGFNVDLFTTSYFTVYLGVLYGYGAQIHSRFSVNKYEYYYVDKYPDQASGKSGTFKDYTLEERNTSSRFTRIIIPVGFQYRVIRRRQYSPGMFVELRTGYESYKVNTNKPVSRVVVFFSTGFKFYFQKHK